MKRLRRTGDELLEYEGINTWLQMEIALNWAIGLIPDKLYGQKVWERKTGTLTADGGFTNGGYTDVRTGEYHKDISPNLNDGHVEGTVTPHYEESYGMGGWYDSEDYGYNAGYGSWGSE